MRDMSAGWIPLYRKSLDSPVFADDHLWRLWCYILLTITHRPVQIPVSVGRSRRMRRLAAGQCIYGSKAWSERLGWARTTTDRRLEKLVEMGMVVRESGTHFSVLTVVNHKRYKLGGSKTVHDSGHPSVHDRAPIGHIQEEIKELDGPSDVGPDHPPSQSIGGVGVPAEDVGDWDDPIHPEPDLGRSLF